MYFFPQNLTPILNEIRYQGYIMIKNIKSIFDLSERINSWKKSGLNFGRKNDCGFFHSPKLANRLLSWEKNSQESGAFGKLPLTFHTIYKRT